ncbi:MAG: hypothetical protein ABGX04_16050 [Myxococcales bacterium]|nr:hypothetical protein [Myxococcales bacterium]HIK86150.1 hypothetical protein [Myxococcales bacterium]
MSLHPLIALVADRDVKQAKGFRAAAEKLTGASIETDYQLEVTNSPRRSGDDLAHLGIRSGRKAKGRQHGRDEKHLAEAIARAAKDGGEESLVPASLELPTGESIRFIDSSVPIRTAAPDKGKGDSDPNAGIEDIPLLALVGEDRVAVVVLKYLDPDATRSGAGDTPLRLLLQGLVHAAATDANGEALRAEISEATGQTTGGEAPAVVIAASPKYWELCRKREAQKGAAWIRELERIAREIGETIGTEVFFVGLTLDPASDSTSDPDSESNPGWSYDDEGPLLSSQIGFVKAWETGAGKLKPKPKKKKVDPADEIIEADLSKPLLKYSIRDSYERGDRLAHTKLGEGVVQGVVGRGKIAVMFGEEKKLLVHERA